MSYIHKSPRVVVFGGVFDPVHNGHIAAARKALELYGDRAVFLPERVPWRKHGSTGYQYRLAMLKRALKNEPQMSALDYPHDKQMIAETFQWLAEQFPGSEFVWLVGSDVVDRMADWPDIERLPDLNVHHVVVAFRQGTPARELPKIPGLEILYFKTRDSQLSSGEIRDSVAQDGIGIPAGIGRYIKEHKLY